MPPDQRVFVLDTNVLLTDPAAVFRFMEHDVYIPMVVLEELDAVKKGVSDLARSARQVSRNLDELIKDADRVAIEQGIPLHDPALSGDKLPPLGRLLLQSRAVENGELPARIPGNSQDNQILSCALDLQRERSDREVILVTKDINLRIKAHMIGVSAEDYYNDKTLDDIDILYTGMRELDATAISGFDDEGQVEVALDEDATPCYPNECLYTEGESSQELLADSIEQQRVLARRAINYRNEKNNVWGINARNREQNFALNLLMDPEIDFVTLLGVAGTGKTLLALAAGLAQTLDRKLYREIIVTRETISLGEDIGFLPGTEEEKMTPWMGALVDNLEVLTENPEGGDWGRAATADLLNKRIKIRSLGFMRGRTFTNRFVIVDEAQNMTAKQMRAIVSRAGPGTKLVCLGNIAQIDSPYLSETTSGLTYVVNKFRAWAHSGHITLRRGERSRLAEFAATALD